jgi:hypothetical protein
MRFGSTLTLTIALAALTASCGPIGFGNASGNETAAAREGPAVSATLANGACTLRWDGAAVDADEITRRSMAVMERAIADAGGIARMTEDTIPVARFEATPDTPYACFGPALMALKAGALSIVELPAPHGVGGAGRPAQLALGNLVGDPPQVTLALGAGGRLSWNDEPIELAALRSRVRGGGGRMTPFGESRPMEEPPPGLPGASAVPEPVEERPPPGTFALAPAPDLSFAEFLAVVQAVFEGGEIAMIP